MDPKQKKAVLKQAKQAIQVKNFDSVTQLCESILEGDPNDYTALVFLGVAAEGLHKFDAAVTAYKRATVVLPKELLAWQGLCSYYEKHPPANANDLSIVYEKLIVLNESNEEKVEEHQVKLCHQFMKEKPLSAVQVVSKVENVFSSLKLKENQDSVLLALIKYLFSKFPLLESSLQAKYMELCEKSIFNATSDDHHRKLWIKYLDLLCSICEDRDKVLMQTELIIQKFSATVETLERVISIATELSLCNLPYVDVAEYVTKLTELAPDSNTLKLYHYQMKSSNGELVKMIVPVSQTTCVHTLLALQSLNKNDLQSTEKHCKDANEGLTHLLPCMSDCKPVYEEMINEILMTINYRSEKYREFVSLYRKQPVDKCTMQYAISLLELGESDEQSIVNCGEKASLLRGYKLLKTGFVSDAYELLLVELEKFPNEPLAQLWFGQACWQISEHQKKSAMHFLLAAKLDSQSGDSFYYLGLYYINYRQPERGMKCLKKALSLNPHNECFSVAYVDQLMLVDDKETALDILVHITSTAPTGTNGVAWSRLGMIRSSQQKHNDAITCFQQALRANDKDSNVWECLADEYVKRGSYTAGLRTFERALELNPSSVYSLYQKATIKYKLGLFIEALIEFTSVIETNPQYVPALKGIAAVHIGAAKDGLKHAINGKVVKNVEEAVVYLTQAVSARSDLSCVWRDLGEALTLLCPLPNDISMKCPAKLGYRDSERDFVTIGKSEALQIGGRCYAQAIHLTKDSSFLWHDISINFLYQSRIEHAEKKQILLKSAFEFAKQAVALDSSISAHHNLLGVIYMKQGEESLAAAQHYLIQSIEADAHNVQAWTNLAALYIKQEDIDLAHEALKVAQSADPRYNECWTGQAIVAEIIGHQEAMDLFRHTTELGNNTESLLGYAHWVLTMLMDTSKHNTSIYAYSIDRMEAVPVACDAVGRFLSKNPSCTQALNAYALLLERQGLKLMALKAMRRCMKITADMKVKNLYRSNFARLLCSCGEFEEALLQLNEKEELSTSDVTLQALLYYKLNEYKKSFDTYTSLVDKYDNEEDKSHIYTAMGMLAQKCDDMDLAKTALFKCSQFVKPSVYGLAALCSLGLLTDDSTLAIAALEELLKVKGTHVLQTKLHSYICALQGDTMSARNVVLKALHKSPLDPTLHELLLTLALQYLPSSIGAISKFSTTVTSVQDLSAVACIAAGDTRKGFRDAQKAVHQCPDESSNWVLLSCVSAAKKRLSDSTLTADTVESLSLYAGSHYEKITPALQKCLTDHILFCAEEMSSVSLQGLLQELNAETVDSPLRNLLHYYTNKDAARLQAEVTSNPNCLVGWLILGEMFKHGGTLEDYTSVMEMAASSLAETHQADVPILLLSKHILEYLMTNPKVPEAPDLKEKFLKHVRSVESSTSQLLEALYHKNISKNYKFAVKLFEWVMRQERNRSPVMKKYAQLQMSELR